MTVRYRAEFGPQVCFTVRPQPTGKDNLKVRLIVLGHLVAEQIDPRGVVLITCSLWWAQQRPWSWHPHLAGCLDPYNPAVEEAKSPYVRR